MMRSHAHGSNGPVTQRWEEWRQEAVSECFCTWDLTSSCIMEGDVNTGRGKNPYLYYRVNRVSCSSRWKSAVTCQQTEDCINNMCQCSGILNLLSHLLSLEFVFFSIFIYSGTLLTLKYETNPAENRLSSCERSAWDFSITAGLLCFWN